MDVYEVGPFTSFDRRLGLRLGSGGRVCNIDIWEADYGSVALDHQICQRAGEDKRQVVVGLLRIACKIKIRQLN